MLSPLSGLGLVFCAGIICCGRWEVPLWIFWLAGFLTLAALFWAARTRLVYFIHILAFLLGCLFIRNSLYLAPDHIYRLVPQKAQVALTGVVCSDPEGEANKAFFVLNVEQVLDGAKWKKASGLVLARCFSGQELGYGDRLFLRGRIYPPFSFSKGFDYRAYLQQRNIYLVLSLGEKSSQVKVLGKNAANPAKAISIRIKLCLKRMIQRNLSAFSSGVINALILGERQELPAHFVDILMKLGTIHIIAISGFNVGIVAFIILLILKIAKVPRKTRYLLTVLLLVVYCLLTGSSAPVVRSTLMAAILLGAYFFRRQVDVYNCLAASAVIILAFNPWQIFAISFQLSFLSVFFISWLSPKIKALLPAAWDKIPWIRFLSATFSVSCAAWIGLFPLTAFYFKIFSPITVLANMIIVPYAGLLTVTGFSLALAGIFAPALAACFASPNELLVRLLFKIHSLFVAIPGAYFKLPEVPFIFIPTYYLLLVLIFNLPIFKIKLP